MLQRETSNVCVSYAEQSAVRYFLTTQLQFAARTYQAQMRHAGLGEAKCRQAAEEGTKLLSKKVEQDIIDKLYEAIKARKRIKGDDGMLCYERKTGKKAPATHCAGG